MRNITNNFLNNLCQNKMEDKQMNSIIYDYVQNLDPSETVPIDVLDRSGLDSEQFLELHRQDVSSFIHKAVALKRNLIIDEYVDCINFSIFSVDGNAVKSMSLEEQKRIWLEIKLRLNTCPFLSESSFIVEVFDDLIWVEWTLPMPIKTSGFSKDQLRKLESNILHYFRRYFDTQNCALKFFPLSQYDASADLYDKVFFPNVFLECFGLSIDYKVAQ